MGCAFWSTHELTTATLSSMVAGILGYVKQESYRAQEGLLDALFSRIGHIEHNNRIAIEIERVKFPLVEENNDVIQKVLKSVANRFRRGVTRKMERVLTQKVRAGLDEFVQEFHTRFESRCEALPKHKQHFKDLMMGAYMTPGFPVVSGTVAAAAIGGSTVYAYANHRHQQQKLEPPVKEPTIPFPETVTGDTDSLSTISGLSEDGEWSTNWN